MYPSLAIGLQEALTPKVIKIFNCLEQRGCKMHFFSNQNNWHVLVLHPDNRVTITDLVALSRDIQIENDVMRDEEIADLPSPEPLALYPARLGLSFFAARPYTSQYPLKTDADPTFLEWLAEKEPSNPTFQV